MYVYLKKQKRTKKKTPHIFVLTTAQKVKRNTLKVNVFHTDTNSVSEIQENS